MVVLAWPPLMTANDLLLPWTLAVLVGALLVVRHRLSLFHPATGYFVFHVVVFCLRPTLLVATGETGSWDVLGVTPSAEHLRLAVWVSTAGLVVFAAVTELVLAGGPRLQLTAPADFDASDRRALLVTAGAAAVPGLVALWVTKTGSVDNRHVADLIFLLLPITLLVVVSARWRWWSFAPFLVWTWIAAGSAPSTAWHGFTTALVIVLFAMWGRQRTHLSPALLLGIAGCAVGVVLFDPGAWSQARRTHAEVPRTGSTQPSPLETRLKDPAFAHVERLALVIDDVATRQRVHSRGAQHAPVLTGEPPARPHDLDTARPGAMSSVADGWLSGGWSGVVVTLALVSLLFAGLTRWFAQRPASPAAACLTCIALAFAIPLHARGDPGMLRAVVFSAAPLALWHALAGRFRRGAAAERERERLREQREQRRLLGHALLHPQAAPLPPELIERASATPSTAYATNDADEDMVEEDETEERAIAPAVPGPDLAVQPPAPSSPASAPVQPAEAPSETGRPAPRWRDTGGP